jgi:hypothetical protein
MLLSYFFFFLTLGSIAQATPDIKVLPAPQRPEDFEHQFKGCPENSECDQVMGLQLQRWKDLVSKLRDEKILDQKKIQFLELFRSKYGIPTEFYTTQKSQQGFKPLFFNSACKAHNPKQSEKRTLKGMAFLKSLNEKTAQVWRDQSQIEVPLEKDLLNPQPVIVYYPEGSKKYHLSLTDQPLFIKDKNLFVLKEEDGFFYTLKIAPDGNWKVEDLDLTELSKWEDKRQEVACPADKNHVAPDEYKVSFCKSVWDQSAGSLVTVKMHLGCVL